LSDYDFVTKKTHQLVDDAVDALPERERRVLQLRYGLVDGVERTLKEVGKMLGISKQAVHQIEKRALEKLSQSGMAEDLDSLLK
jgi:RNA polymerase primary sigma factor